MGVALIVDEMRENRLRYLGHSLRSEETEAVRVVKGIFKRNQKTKKEVGDVIENDLW